MKFYEMQGALYVQDGQDKEVLISGHFMQSENQAKLSDYLHLIAGKLNAMEPFSDEMSDCLQEIEYNVSVQATAEKFMEEVSF